MKQIFSLVAVFGCMLAYTSCSQPAQRSNPFAADSLVADQEGWDVSFTVSESGLPKLSVFAEYMARYEVDDSTYSELGLRRDSLSTGQQVRIELFDDSGNLSAITRADKVIYSDDTIQFEATGRVTVTTPGGRRLESQQLSWDSQSGRIVARGFVRITTSTEQVQGYDLSASETLADYTIYRISGQAFLDDDF